MKRKELYDLLNGFETVKDLKGVKFAYARAKNKKLVLAELELLKDVLKDSEKFVEYDKKRIELCEVYCTKDDKGKPVIKNRKYDGLTKNEEFTKKLEKLGEEFKEVIEQKKKNAEEYQTLLDGEVDIPLHKIKLDDVPSDITGAQLESIDFILE